MGDKNVGANSKASVEKYYCLALAHNLPCLHLLSVSFALNGSACLWIKNLKEVTRGWDCHLFCLCASTLTYFFCFLSFYLFVSYLYSEAVQIERIRACHGKKVIEVGIHRQPNGRQWKRNRTVLFL